MTARTRTLGELREDVLWQADRQGTSLRNEPARVNRAINQSIAEFREHVSDNGHPYFLRATAGTLAVGPTSPYHFGVVDLSALSPGHLRVYGFDVQVQNIWHSLDAVLFQARNQYQRDDGAGGIPAVFFQYARDSVAYAPASDVAYPYQIWDLPVHADLATDGATFDGLNGWEEWVVFSAVSKLLLRDRDGHLERFQAERARLLEHILRKATQRQRSGPIQRGGRSGGDADARRFLQQAGDSMNQPGSGEVGRVALAAANGKLSYHPGQDEGDDLKWSGGIWVKRRGWIQPNVDTTGVVAADAVIAAAVATRDGACVELPEGTIKVTSPLSMALNGLTLLGRGDYGTTLVLDGAANQDWIVMGALAQRLENIRIVRATMPSSTPTGYAVKVLSSFGAKLEKLWLENVESGILVRESTDTQIRHVKLRNIFGQYGIFCGGGAAFGNQTLLDEVRADNPYPLTYPAVTDVGTWAASTAVSLNEVVVVASVLLWQCTTAGTTAATNSTLTAIPSSTPSLARSTAVTNGTAQFKYVGRADSHWVRLDSYGGDLEMRSCALLNGGRGFSMGDAAVPGNRSSIVSALGLKIDHPLDECALLEAGFDVDLQGWFSSSLRGRALNVGASFGYDWSVHDSRLFGCALDGALINNGGHGAIRNCRIGYNGQLASNTYDGVQVSANASHFQVDGNRIGQLNGTGTNPQRYAVNVNAAGSASYYSILGNWARGNQTAGVSHPSGTGAQVTGNVV